MVSFTYCVSAGSTEELCDEGALTSDNVFRQAVGDASVKMVRLSDKYLEAPESFKLTPKQKKVAELLAEYGAAALKEAAATDPEAAARYEALLEREACNSGSFTVKKTKKNHR